MYHFFRLAVPFKNIESGILFSMSCHLLVSENELKQVQELFSQAADNCLNLKKPD